MFLLCHLNIAPGPIFLTVPPLNTINYSIHKPPALQVRIEKVYRYRESIDN